VGFLYFFVKEFKNKALYFSIILLVPFIFYIVTLFLGQSVIFLPGLTPKSFEWTLFNARYGLMAIPVVAFFYSYFFAKGHMIAKIALVSLFIYQLFLFKGFTGAITLSDGVKGLSASKIPDANYWIEENYDGGMVLLDDYARTISIVRTNIPMHDIIYIGSKPYWSISLKEPEKFARWVIMQKNDDIWKSLYENKAGRGRLFKYFKKTYTSKEILIFKRNDSVASR
jgi:hypothetical protein